MTLQIVLKQLLENHFQLLNIFQIISAGLITAYIFHTRFYQKQEIKAKNQC